MLAEAGFPDGEGLPEMKLTVKIGNEEQERMAIFIQDSLSQIGMNVEIEKLAPRHLPGIGAENGKLQMFMDNWISWGQRSVLSSELDLQRYQSLWFIPTTTIRK